ncbi:MAG: Clp protease ClpP [Bauldia sp.]|nr:Clp protease ClpP [Bauldia sp.]
MLKPVGKKPSAPAAPTGYRMVNRAGRGEIYLYGPIGMSWFGDGVTARQFAKDLKELGAVTTIDLRINSEGGSVPEAEAIYTHLVEHKAGVTAHIDGMAASAASFIAMAGDEILISDSGFVMIHDARMLEYGTADDFRRAADLLDRTTEKIVQKYARRTKNDEKTIRDWMKDETWFIGEEAVENGFADKVVENLKVAAVAGEAVSRLQSTLNRHPDLYKHIPGALMPRRAALRAVLSGLRAA